ncbi:hypothetical protein VNI00_015345 [Paramarasmius palmivorus]|uniref:Protein kinase domain-containing protein n=1 Tax=Paramarasmius palmivorus TaxID=297713 RepID=A0AAW0BMB0_9AGAR
MDRPVVTTERVQTTRLADGKKMVNHYVLDAKIGKGMHGTVWKCHDHLNEPKIFAMKIVKRETQRARRERQYKQLRNRNNSSMPPRTDHVPVVDGIRTAEQEIRKEIAIMKKCRHPHVVKLYEVIDDRKNDQIFMVMEHLGGGEIKYTNGNNQPILTVDQTRRIMRDAILGLEYLHHQGIIHRDIKPANLIWTSNHDRVKIADFGTAHFSYAQCLVAAAQDGAAASSKDDEDPILLNDADLAKRAGSPAFLAPEIVWEYMEDPAPPRPPVTKAIDIWALGVTLYCLLFGKTPFRPPGTYALGEWTGYQWICNHDWRAPSRMGYDQVRTGGRHPSEEEIERGEVGPTVIHLLDHFLKKDMDERITLEEVKTNRWFLQDLPNPSTWLEITSPNPIQVSAKEASDAMSTLRFRWAMWGKKGTAGAAGTTTSTGTATGSTSISSRPIVPAIATQQASSASTSSQGSKSIAKRLAALLSRSATPATMSPATSASPASSSTSTVAGILGLRVHRSQGAIRSPEKKEKKSKSKSKKGNGKLDEDMGDRGRVISEPNMRLRRIKSDRDAEAERAKRDKRERELERRRRKKAAAEAVNATPMPTQPVRLPPDKKGKQKERPEAIGQSSSKTSTSTSRMVAPSVPNLSTAASVHSPVPSRARSGSVRSIRGNASSEQRSASPSGKRLTGLFSSLAHWRPSSRGSHYSQSGYGSPPGSVSGYGSPVEERDTSRDARKRKEKQKTKSKGRVEDVFDYETTATATNSTPTATTTSVTVTGPPATAADSDDSDIEFADPETYVPAIVAPPPPLKPYGVVNNLLSSSADELPRLDTWISTSPTTPNTHGPASLSSRSSSSAALFAASGSGSASGRSASPTAPPVLSRAPASAVMFGHPGASAGATLAATAIAISGGAGVAEGSIGSVDSSNSSLGGIANRRISSWDHNAGAAADARSLTSSRSDDFDDDDEYFVEGEDGYHVAYREERDMLFGAGGVGRRDEVVRAHQGRNVFDSRTPSGSSRGQMSRPSSGMGHLPDGTPARPGGGGIIIMSDEVASFDDSDDEYDDEQGTYEGTVESTVEAGDEEVRPHDYSYAYNRGSSYAGEEDEDEGLVFSTKKRKDDRGD